MPGGSPPRFAVGGGGLRLRYRRGSPPRRSADPPAREARREGEVKVGVVIGFGNRGFVPSSFSRNIITLPPRFACREGRRRASRSAGRARGCGTAGGTLPGEAPTLPLAKRGGRVKSRLGLKSGLATAVVLHRRLAETSSPSRRVSRAGRVAAALRGRRGGPAVAVPPGQPSPAKRRPSRSRSAAGG